jgi:hypothetical protein
MLDKPVKLKYYFVYDKKTTPLIAIFFTVGLFGQLSPTLYTQDYFGLQLKVTRQMDAELRVMANHSNNYFRRKNATSIETELLLRITTIQKEYARLSLGVVGAGFILEDRDPINAFIFPAQIEISPFKNELSFLSFIAEPSLLSYLEGEIQIRMLLGMKIRL